MSRLPLEREMVDVLCVAIRTGGHDSSGKVTRGSVFPVSAAGASAEAVKEWDAGNVVSVALRRGVAKSDSFGLLGPALAAVLDEGFLGMLDGEAVIGELEIAVIHEDSSLSFDSQRGTW